MGHARAASRLACGRGGLALLGDEHVVCAQAGQTGVHVWDWAAAALIAAEAGAHVRTATTPDGAGFVVAAAPGLGAAFEGALERCGVVAR